jgi:hypothetical protein
LTNIINDDKLAEKEDSQMDKLIGSLIIISATSICMCSIFYNDMQNRRASLDRSHEHNKTMYNEIDQLKRENRKLKLINNGK